LSGVFSWHNFRGTSWRLLIEPRMRVGQATPLRLQVRNAKTQLPSYGLTFHIATTSSAQRLHIPIQGALEPASEQVLEHLHTPLARGREVVEMAEVESLFPFGFLRKSITGGGPLESSLVWPRRVDYSFVPPARATTRQQGERAVRRGQGTELMGLRDYRHGDPQRLVHWKATARLGRLLVRETAEELGQSYSLWVGAAASEWRGEAQFETLCAVAGSLAEDLYMRGVLGTCGVAGGAPTTIRRLSDLHNFLDALALLEPGEAVGATPPARSRLITFRPLRNGGVGILVDGNEAGTA
jgi:uncharacterized protein (DUF58 family)